MSLTLRLVARERLVVGGSTPFSPISPEALAEGRVSVSGLFVTGRTVWWSESRPSESGRQVVLKMDTGPGLGTGRDDLPWTEASPPGVSARSSVHEYGGGAFAVGEVGAETTLLFTDQAEQALWRLDEGGTALRLTPPAAEGEDHRYADARTVAGSGWVVALRERHTGGDVTDEIVALRDDGSQRVWTLLSGRDFYAAPRPSPSGRQLAWTCWDHPNMPWDGCELWLADLVSPGEEVGGTGLETANPLLVAGGPAESVGQPRWSPDETLWFMSDRFGWWQPYRLISRRSAPAERVCDEPAEFHAPDWVLGQSTFDFLSDGSVLSRMRRDGIDRLVAVYPSSGEAEEMPQPCVTISGVAVSRGVRGEDVVFVMGATPESPTALHSLTTRPGHSEIGRLRMSPAFYHSVLRRPTRVETAGGTVSRARPMSFETEGGTEAHLLFFPPERSLGEAGDASDASSPPLIVWCHGGPTGACEPGFDIAIQFWTSRGFGVAAVDYRGSSGYGRSYRELLYGNWGIADATDCSRAAVFLAEAGLADPARAVVRGASAGGLTALRSATAGGPFAAAVVLYGVSDLRALALETHKFESRYLDRLVGPWPEAASEYDERSPARHPETVGAPVLLLQGADDRVVPPSQASSLAEGLRERGIRCDHVLFEGEGHGFRRAETIAAAARAEIAFLEQVLGLSL